MFEEILFILFWLVTKHFIIDFLIQTKFQYSNKGIFLHPGGILHSTLHSIGTFIIFINYNNLDISCTLASIDFICHYLIDYSKVNINNYFKLSPINSEKFWWLLGLDQYMHSLTYIVLIYINYKPPLIVIF